MLSGNNPLLCITSSQLTSSDSKASSTTTLGSGTLLKVFSGHVLRATSHTRQEPVPWNCEREPKRKCPKAAPTHFRNHLMWSWALECSYEVICNWAFNQMLFQWISIHAGFSHMIKYNKSRSWDFGVKWSPGFVLGILPRGGFLKQSMWPWNMIYWMPCKNPCRLYIHLAFTYYVGPLSVVWTELGPASPFPPMRVLEVHWSRALSLVWEVALKMRSFRVTAIITIDYISHVVQVHK